LGSHGVVLGSLRDYLAEWEYNASAYLLLKNLITAEIARPLVGLLFLGWLAFLIVRKMDIQKKLFGVYGGFIVLTTTLFPWYFVWIFPFILSHLSVAFLLLSSTILLSYNGHDHIGFEPWSHIHGMTLVIYAPFYALLAWGVLKRRLGART